MTSLEVETSLEVKRALVTSERVAWKMMEPSQWQWSDLRDYIIFQSESMFGPAERNPAKESSIVKSFMKRWGPMAVPIAQRAFTVYEGVWWGEPVRIERFALGNDGNFAQVLAGEVVPVDQ